MLGTRLTCTLIYVGVTWTFHASPVNHNCARMAKTVIKFCSSSSRSQSRQRASSARRGAHSVFVSAYWTACACSSSIIITVVQRVRESFIACTIYQARAASRAAATIWTIDTLSRASRIFILASLARGARRCSSVACVTNAHISCADRLRVWRAAETGRLH